MACGLGACMGCSIPQKAGGYKRACKEGPVFDARDIDWSERVVCRFRIKESMNKCECKCEGREV